MEIRRSWLPHPLLSLLLLVLWLLLNNGVSPGHLVLGALLAVVIPMFTRRFWPEPARVGRPGLAIRLTLRVLKDIVVANFAVARLVLGSSERIQPRFVRVPLDLDGEVAVTVLASVISLTPGTVSASLDAERRSLLVHALSEDDPSELVYNIKTRYEAPIKEIFSC